VHGKWFEELELGLVVPHALTRTVLDADNVAFSTMTMNPARLHLDFDYAERETEFGRPLVNSLLTLSILVGVSVLETTHGTTIANLGFQEVQFRCRRSAGTPSTPRRTSWRRASPGPVPIAGSSRSSTGRSTRTARSCAAPAVMH
jgi:hypothetical protein